MQPRINQRGLMLTAAFVVGFAVGMAALHHHHDQAAAQAEQNDVSLIAVFGGVSGSEEDFRYDINLYSNGSFPVEIEAARLIAPGYGVSARDHPVLQGKRLNPKAWLTLRAVHGSPMCPDTPVAGDPVLALDLTRAGGEMRQIELPVLDRYGAFASARASACDAVLHPESAVTAYHQGTVLQPVASPSAYG